MLRQRRHVALMPLLLAALLLRGLLPLGYMPAATPEAAFGLAFCTSSNPELRPGAEPQSPSSGEHQDCPYGFALGMGALLAEPARASFAYATTAAAATLVPGLVPAIAGPPFAARGPPVSSGPVV